MKRFIAALLVLGAMALFVTGCFPKEEKTTVEAAVEKVKEHPAAEHPAPPAPPKDHPTH